MAVQPGLQCPVGFQALTAIPVTECMASLSLIPSKRVEWKEWNGADYLAGGLRGGVSRSGNRMAGPAVTKGGSEGGRSAGRQMAGEAGEFLNAFFEKRYETHAGAALLSIGHPPSWELQMCAAPNDVLQLPFKPNAPFCILQITCRINYSCGNTYGVILECNPCLMCAHPVGSTPSISGHQG